jgi:hypothetical protein
VASLPSRVFGDDFRQANYKRVTSMLNGIITHHDPGTWNDAGCVHVLYARFLSFSGFRRVFLEVTIHAQDVVLGVFNHLHSISDHHRPVLNRVSEWAHQSDGNGD